MERIGHGKISLTRTQRHHERHLFRQDTIHVFPVIELEVDVFQTKDNELKFFYAPDRNNDAHLTIELKDPEEDVA